jgi:hypothetical protein
VFVCILYVHACKTFLIVLCSAARSMVEKCRRLSRKICSIIEVVRFPGAFCLQQQQCWHFHWLEYVNSLQKDCDKFLDLQVNVQQNVLLCGFRLHLVHSAKEMETEERLACDVTGSRKTDCPLYMAPRRRRLLFL